MTNYSSLKQAGKLSGTIKAAKAKRQQRDNCRRKPRSVKGMAATVLIPLGSADSERVERIACRRFPRRQNWTDPESNRNSRDGDVRTNDLGRYSRRCSYKHLTYTPLLRSCGRCTPTHLVAFVGPLRFHHRAWKGWEFGTDEYGMFAVRSSKRHRVNYRYHFDSDEARSRSALFAAARRHEREQILAKRNAKQRVREDAQRAAVRDTLVKSGRVWVSFRDARKAGNCAAGIRAFCNQHGWQTILATLAGQ